MYAGFFVRLVAYVIDSLLATLAAAMIKSPFSLAAVCGLHFLDANFIFQHSFLDVLGYVGVAAYFVLLTYFTHTTAGKKIMRLEVVTEDGEWTFLNVLYRETIGRFLTSLLCIGYLVVLGHEKKQGFHDMLCDTYVVYKDMLPKHIEKPVAPAMYAPVSNVNAMDSNINVARTEMSEVSEVSVNRSFDQMNPDCSNLANMQNLEDK